MTVWNGQGLPPAAQARIDRARTDHVRTSLLSVAGQAGAHSVGLDPVGEVMGTIVEQIGWAGWGGCGVYYGGGFGSRWQQPATVTSGAGGGGWAGYRPYVDALYRGYDTALARMLAEAEALRADGVVGISWTQQRMPDAPGLHEFVAKGTAVRARSSIRPAHVFSTDQSGADVAKLMHAGWVPRELVMGISVAIRHDDYATRYASSWNGRNVEVPGYTELVRHTRADARDRFRERAARHGAEAATVSDMRLQIWSIEPGENHRDHVAEATVLGSSVAHFHAGVDAPTDTRLAVAMRPVRRRQQRRSQV